MTRPHIMRYIKPAQRICDYGHRQTQSRPMQCVTLLTSRARGLHQHRGSGVADTDRLVPWKASLRSAGVAKITESEQAGTPIRPLPIGVKFSAPNLRNSMCDAFDVARARGFTNIEARA